MSRPGPSRNLTLTEELEKLEQSITLTLQEIDHNFSKAHRIVTSSILPLVEQYGEHSKNVWDASKFWKQFFEASANVSLSGYEELANEEDTAAEDGETTQLTDATPSNEATARDHEDSVDHASYQQQQQQQQQQQHDRRDRRDVEDSLLDDASLAGSTPRPPATKTVRSQTQFADLHSPYENLRRELGGGDKDNKPKTDLFPDDDDEDQDDTSQLDSRLPDMSMTPHSPSVHESLTPANQRDLLGGKGKSQDPLLHRVLDKTFRIQATPHKGAGAAGRGFGPVSPDKHDKTRRTLWNESPASSPEMAAPTLRTNLYAANSPLKAPRGLGAAAGREGPRTPGVSVQTPATARKKKDVFADLGQGQDKDKGKGMGMGGKNHDEITWDSDEDGDDTGFFGGMSPPKTIQFALPPSKLMQTPAREASKRIVDDILLTAGAAPEYNDRSSEYSPTMVKMNQDVLDDTF